MDAATGPHSIIEHTAPMHCETCGRVTSACECPPETLRRWKCMDCGFHCLTGGPSLLDLLGLKITYTRTS